MGRRKQRRRSQQFYRAASDPDWSALDMAEMPSPGEFMDMPRSAQDHWMAVMDAQVPTEDLPEPLREVVDCLEMQEYLGALETDTKTDTAGGVSDVA